MIGIRRRYETVNNFLILKPNLKIPEIKILSKIHLMTTESIEMFNIVYGPAVILFISLGFGWFCMFIFTLVMFPPIMWTDLLFVSLYNVLVNVMSFTTVAILFYYGEWTKKEARRTVKLLYKIIDDVNCEKIERKMQKMISQICDMKVEFSCGLVDFNWKFFFKDLGINFNYKNDRKLITKIILGMFALIIIGLAISLSISIAFFRFSGISVTFLNLYLFACKSMLIFQLISAMIGIRRRFEAVNIFLVLVPNLKIQEIEILSELHLMTTESIEMFNIVYGPAVLLFISLGFGWFCMFIFVAVMFPPIMWTKFIFVSLYNIIVNIISFITVAIVFYYGESTKKEARRTVKLLYKMIEDANCEKVERKMQKMISQICDTKIEFSCGLVDFNWKFFFKFVTAAIMYFIILVQFESSFDKNH
ncbi:unnamed protein product [Chironomus riparius]|uniref:Gustatory receptor n=1 Tax=Chironomus riparius TaxID=315576 RepID=A0A9N9WXZ9_9DIPT|nr:unnamed protein product [Chironomus riparius]